MKFKPYTYKTIKRHSRESKYGRIMNENQKRKEQEAIQKILKIIG
jgi:hypothetical protein